jgi:hypothetical protein
MSSPTFLAESFEPNLGPQAEMSLNPKDKEWIELRIRDVCRAPSGTTTPSEVSRTKLGRIREWASPAIVVGLVITVFLEWTHFTNDMAVFRTHTEDRLKQIELKLGLQSSLQTSIDATLKQLANIDPIKFSESLPALRKISEQSPLIQYKLDPSTVHKVAEKLRQTNESSPDYWPTVLQFLQFASAGTEPPGVPPPNARGLLKTGPLTSATIDEEGQVIILDGGRLENSTLVRCRIRFTENPVRMTNVRFIDCVFELPVVAKPNDYLKKATKILLASNLQSVSIPSL